MEDKKIIELLAKYRRGECSPEEKAMLESWYINQLADTGELTSEINFEARKEEHWKAVVGLAPAPAKIRSIKPYRWIAAASLLFVATISSYYVWHKLPLQQNAQIQSHDLAPGGNRAVLVLANGKHINLTSAKTGNIALQGNIAVSKTADGQVLYQTEPSSENKAPAGEQYNELKTPGGGKYELTLADGTKVWLNAASGIKYPVAFTGKERKVEIKGEAYFEVVHNAAKPFRVVVAGQTIEDMGTHFNVNAYTDEPEVSTTLLEGSVKISNTLYSSILKPGEQARIATGEAVKPFTVISNADTEEAIAWHLGLFKFDHADIKTVMRQIGRWYDVTVEYEGTPPPVKLSGEMYRSLNASAALQLLKYAKINFRIENKKIIVTP